MVEAVGFGLIFVLYAFFHACVCCWIAESKGYAGGVAFLWFILGGLFGVFALLTIGLCEPAETSKERREKRRAEEKAEREKRLSQIKEKQEAAMARKAGV